MSVKGHTIQYQTVAKLGETIRFDKKHSIKASFKSSTSAVFNLSNRAFYIEGQAFKGNYGVGDYFIRDVEPKGNVYMVATVLSEPTSHDLVYLFGMQCNALVTITRDKGRAADEEGNLVYNLEVIAKDIPVYRDFTTRQPKQTNDGALDQGIYTMYIPHKWLVSQGDRITMPYNVDGELKDTDFVVDNVGAALSAPDGAGIDALQLSIDLRDDNTEEETDGEENADSDF